MNLYLENLIQKITQRVNKSIVIELGNEKGKIKQTNQEIVIYSDSDEMTKQGLIFLQSLEDREINNFETIQLVQKQIERGLMIDIGRKFYSLLMLKQLVDTMSELNMNYLQLHFSENEGFRIECHTFPQIMSQNYLRTSEVKELIAYAKERFITIIPEFDSPGHLRHFLNYFPEWHLSNDPRPDELIPSNRALDITNESARRAIKTIISEYIELFSDSPYFHIGADEFVVLETLETFKVIQDKLSETNYQKSNGYDLFIDYINEMVTFVESKGKIARLWNDSLYKKGITTTRSVATTAEVTYWTRHDTKMASVTQIIKNGHSIINFNDNYFYFVLGEAAGYEYPTPEKINDWELNKFAQNQLLTETEMKSVLGTYFAIWSDVPEALSELEVLNKVTECLQELGPKFWQVTIKNRV